MTQPEHSYSGAQLGSHANPMRFAYADPPYLGMCGLYQHHHPDGRCWNDIETHAALIDRLSTYDSWALSTGAKQLQPMLAICPNDIRVAAWVKPFTPFSANPAWAWEPVIFRGARKRPPHDDAVTTVRDWIAATSDAFLGRNHGLRGAKPRKFCFWLFDLMGLRSDDDFCDLFPGTGAVTRAWREWSGRPPEDVHEQAVLAI
jgi:hypothetical protein